VLEHIELSLLLLSFAFLLQTIEYFYLLKKISFFFNSEKNIKITLTARLILILVIPILLLHFSFLLPFALATLIIIQFYFFNSFNGPFNGGSDYISTLLLLGHFIMSAFLMNLKVIHFVSLYIAIQTVLSYFLPGIYKLLNQSWRTGLALNNIALSPNFSIPINLKTILTKPILSKIICKSIVLLEVFFPLLLFILPKWPLIIGLIIFHFINFLIFGLNRFIFAWIAAYPFLFWFKDFVLSQYN